MIKKSAITSNGSEFRISVPLTKIDEERRIVSGFASLDNVDQHDDLVPIEATVRAFNRFRGNIREMHQPIAVGRLLSFQEEKYYDEETQKVYNGVFVRTYVSKGAQDTWEKVLDGTLSGFSIGGVIRDKDSEFDPETQKMVTTIKEFDLQELSLVDSPANQFANVLSIEKMDDGETTATGMVAETVTQNIFWCAPDHPVVTTSDESRVCKACDNTMTNIGWVEATDDAAAIAEVVTKFLGSTGSDVVKNQLNTIDNRASKDTPIENTEDEGGVEKLEKSTEETAETVEKDVVETVAEVEEVTEAEPVEKVADVSEVEDPKTNQEDVLLKALGEIKETLVKSLEGLSTRVDTVEKAIEGFAAKSGDAEKISEALEDVKKSVGTISSEMEDIKTSTGRLEKATAMKKSADLEGAAEETIKKDNTWNGAFVGAESLTSN